ncbi:[FeFe] hydrogenase H-cluster radical SAM maturase HydG [Anaerotalea alkaliphila]|uniref:[FeFe] hydrogenase H-cluster radical SAM maturase HydG n=1 Tax=Anaerotalea alkaliphila TaxID=2662126 RepID=A0A7X5HY37_9FIRM|nr:[FeFe] hydrogenase H-cluster radical SAM maturase HydG [Anaerotalea alkaliphila]NDL68767.1 [FeFe] hydrogenase H-cluster radical SAM maturase HydG [Anaerotalea alkaliphila]
MKKFIDDQKINALLEQGKTATKGQLEAIIAKSHNLETLSLEEVAALLQCEDREIWEKVYATARHIKDSIYGNRVVMFAPLYVSNHCVNGCTYCGYKCGNKFSRRLLTDEEIQREARIIENMGHKRIALEAGEDDKNCPIDYILHAMDVVYKTKSENNGSIRRINVNIAATTVENYRKLKDAGIGTYILFQETYHEESYKAYHPTGPKSDYLYHLTAMDRAMEGGIDDVGIGALFGLYDYKFDVMGLMMHRDHLEEVFGVGPHTISVPRIRKAEDVAAETFPHSVSDEEFERLVAVIRLAVPYTGIILSTREDVAMRERLIDRGVSQVSSGSKTDVGGYSEENMVSQFETADERPTGEVIHALLEKGFLPSYCTACYRAGRTGDRFMQVAKSGNIHNLCHPNAMMTLQEYLEDYADDRLKALGEKVIAENVDRIPNEKMRENTVERLAQIKAGQRDLFF